MYKSIFKRILDFIVATLAFLILLPVFIIIYIILLFTNKGKPLFFQPRPGKGEKTFYIMKFKSMSDETDANGKLLPDDERVTKIGTFLRKSSLDEIPQLLNIIKGEMSIVGPRPLRVRYLPYYTEREQLRHTVRPGVTGLAQVSGRNFLHWDQRLEKDVEYVENLSFWLDIRIILKTAVKVLLRKDIAVDSESVMIDFDTLRQQKMQNKSDNGEQN